MATDTTPDSSTAATAADLEWLSLDDGEELVWTGGPDRRTLLPAVLVGIPLAIVLIGLLIIAGEYLRVTNTHYVVTNRALYRKTGVLSRDVKRIEHGKVQDISYSQSALGAHFGYGTVEISTAGGSGVEMAFKSVPDPRAVQHVISDQRERDHTRRDDRDEHTTDDVLGEILTELRAIRATLEDGEREGAQDRSRAETGRRDRDADRDGVTAEYDERRS
ncbi:PH domain-containing protein [Halopiger aswanensis]|uniref:PH (Pleckstrin Homology) domain-containing protein n=1 Tax=Halopiger aswanensis TaxID=148449 RepID=A0A3R7DF97_9EURY|nr:PH domain-containing protein [Halopiger aswanensis]RKD97745.1 PH (Pleckstrin Homology) domain-containing protein [Halopiger aswanensis]